MDYVTDADILDAADACLASRKTIETRDIYDRLMSARWKGYRGRNSAHRPLTLNRIARVLQNHGYVVADRRGGYARYRRA